MIDIASQALRVLHRHVYLARTIEGLVVAAVAAESALRGRFEAV